MRTLMGSFILVLTLSATGFAKGGDAIKLPAPQVEGGKPLMQALKDRRSTREFSAKTLPPQVLSNLLWAAAGINRPDGHRTAPSARDWREIDVYVVTVDGAYLYDANAHVLRRMVSGDIRALTGTQDFVAHAPVNLVYVADLHRMRDVGADQKSLYSATDTGFIAQNVYLYCASAGLATVVRGSIDRESLAAAMKLTPNQQIILAQSVGYPAEDKQ